MGIFSKKPSGPSREGVQAPDALARRAALACDSGDYAAALDAYGQAIGAIHTMCVMADPGSRTRSPGAGDQAILDGSGDSLGDRSAVALVVVIVDHEGCRDVISMGEGPGGVDRVEDREAEPAAVPQDTRPLREQLRRAG